MSKKIVQAVNAMISNPDKITKVIKNDEEYFFIYRDAYKWSMRKNEEGEHVLWFYPFEENIENLAAYGADDWANVNMVAYKDSEIGTKEARASFAELYTLLKERVFGMNFVLDDIISDANPF